MNTSEILDKAADLIDERGLAKGWYCGPGGTLCARGAIYAAAGYEPEPDGSDHDWIAGLLRHDEVMRAEVLIDQVIGYVVSQWNDAPERTAAEVATALRGAAEAARAEQ